MIKGAGSDGMKRLHSPDPALAPPPPKRPNLSPSPQPDPSSPHPSLSASRPPPGGAVRPDISIYHSPSPGMSTSPEASPGPQARPGSSPQAAPLRVQTNLSPMTAASPSNAGSPSWPPTIGSPHSSALSPTGQRFEDMALYPSPTHDHPAVPMSPTSPTSRPSPTTAAFMHGSEIMVGQKPFDGREYGLSGQPSPGGSNFVFSQKEPVAGTGDGQLVDIESHTRPGDTKVMHTHPGGPGTAHPPSGSDLDAAYRGSKMNPPREEFIYRTPMSNQMGSWYQSGASLTPQGGGRYHGVDTPSNMSNYPLSTNREGFPQVPIPRNEDLTYPSSPSSNGSPSSPRSPD